MFCPNCKATLQPVDEILAVDNWGLDYFTHRCSMCGTRWHVHYTGDEVSLISTRKDENAIGQKVKDNLLVELQKRVADLSDVRVIR